MYGDAGGRGGNATRRRRTTSPTVFGETVNFVTAGGCDNAAASRRVTYREFGHYARDTANCRAARCRAAGVELGGSRDDCLLTSRFSFRQLDALTLPCRKNRNGNVAVN